MTDRLAIGTVQRSHGLKGYFRVRTYSGETEHVARIPTIWLKTGSALRECRVEDVRITGSGALMKIEGVNNPEAVSTLNGSEIWAAREYAAPLEEEEYYVADLVGCIVFRGEARVGIVSSTMEAGGGDLLEIERGDGTVFLIPFRQEFVETVSIGEKRIRLVEDSVIS